MPVVKMPVVKIRVPVRGKARKKQLENQEKAKAILESLKAGNEPTEAEREVVAEMIAVKLQSKYRMKQAQRIQELKLLSI